MGSFNDYIKKTNAKGGEVLRRVNPDPKNERRQRINEYCKLHGITRKQFTKRLRAERIAAANAKRAVQEVKK